MNGHKLLSRVPAERSIHDIKRMSRRLHEEPGSRTGEEDGWLKPVGTLGFRYDYDINIARGGWEFYELGSGLSLVVTDMVAAIPTPRRHNMTGHLVMSLVVSGVIPFADAREMGLGEPMRRGYCTLYGLREGSTVETVYEPGKHLRWITIVIEADRFRDALGIDPSELSPELQGFFAGTTDLAARHIPVSHPSVALAAHDVLECPFEGTARTAFLRAKAIELSCHVLSAMSDPGNATLGERLSALDLRKLERALQVVRATPQHPIRVDHLAAQVGLSRRRLQQGFRHLYGDTVCNVRDKFRMELAFDLVVDSTMSMIEIAMESGYEHPASFTRAFKASFAASPIAVRNAAQAGRVVKRRRTAATRR